MRPSCEWNLTLWSKCRDMDGILEFLDQQAPGGFYRSKPRKLFAGVNTARHIWGNHMLCPDKDIL